MKKAIVVSIAIIAIACIMLSDYEVHDWHRCCCCGKSYDANDENPYISCIDGKWICNLCMFEEHDNL